MAGLFGEGWMDFFFAVCNFKLMAIFVVIGMAKSLANYYKVDSKLAIALSFVGILLLTPVIVTVENVKGLPLDNFSAKGLFVCMIAAALAVEIYRWCVQKGFTIKMPDSVPQNVSSAKLVIPAFLIILLFNISWDLQTEEGLKRNFSHDLSPFSLSGDLVFWITWFKYCFICHESNLVCSISRKSCCFRSWSSNAAYC